MVAAPTRVDGHLDPGVDVCFCDDERVRVLARVVRIEHHVEVFIARRTAAPGFLTASGRVAVGSALVRGDIVASAGARARGPRAAAVLGAGFGVVRRITGFGATGDRGPENRDGETCKLCAREEGGHLHANRMKKSEASKLRPEPEPRSRLLLGRIVGFSNGRERKLLIDLLVPVMKAHCTDLGFEAATLCRQIYGGYGCIREYPVEQLVRDAKVQSIYEGTNGIQALDLLGRKLQMNDLHHVLPQAAALAKTVQSDDTSAPIPCCLCDPAMPVGGAVEIGPPEDTRRRSTTSNLRSVNTSGRVLLLSGRLLGRRSRERKWDGSRSRRGCRSGAMELGTPGSVDLLLAMPYSCLAMSPDLLPMSRTSRSLVLIGLLLSLTSTGCGGGTATPGSGTEGESNDGTDTESAPTSGTETTTSNGGTVSSETNDDSGNSSDTGTTASSSTNDGTASGSTTTAETGAETDSSTVADTGSTTAADTASDDGSSTVAGTASDDGSNTDNGSTTADTSSGTGTGMGTSDTMTDGTGSDGTNGGTSGTSATSAGDSTDGGDTTGDLTCVPTGVLTFDDSDFAYHNDPEGTVAPSNTSELLLIPDNAGNVGVAVLYTQPLVPPYDLHFEYSIFDDDGGPVFNSADGLAVMLLNAISAYDFVDPPDGGERGVIKDGTGYAAHFTLYENRQIYLVNGEDVTLEGPATPSPSVYSHGAWRTVRIEVRTNRIALYYEEDTLAFSHSAEIDTTHTGLGFGAGTGAADGEHRIRNVEITCR